MGRETLSKKSSRTQPDITIDRAIELMQIALEILDRNGADLAAIHLDRALHEARGAQATKN